MKAACDIYSQVTDTIIAKLVQGVAPWQRPWTSAGYGLPSNVVSRKHYNGLNIVLLWLVSEKNGWSSNLFGTYRQWAKLGGHVRRGEKGTKIIFWSIKTETATNQATGEDEEQRRFFLRQYTVFGLEQCGGDALQRFRKPAPVKEFIDFTPAEDAIKATGAEIRHGGSQALYDLANDFVQLPAKGSFNSQAGYYSTALHELCHWTGHDNRLSRLNKLARFGGQCYAMEELIAEMGAAFLTASLGVPNTATLDNAASYLADWLQVLRTDRKAIFTAAAAASKAAEFVLSFSRNVEGEESEPSETGDLQVA